MEFGMTRKMRECLSFIELTWQENGYAPSYDEIMVHLGLKSKSGIHRLINSLVERGAIVRLPARARAIMPLRAHNISLLLPPDLDARLRTVAAQTNLSPESFVTKLIMAKLSIPSDRTKGRAA